MASLVKSKIEQAKAVLRELDIDLWLTACRESSSVPDPVTDLIVGHDIMWLSCFVITRDRAIAVVGSADAADYQRSGDYDEVIVYGQDVGAELRAVVDRIKPRSIALNYSVASYTADGLSHGLFILLEQWFSGTPYAGSFVSAEDIIARIRGRKAPEEIRRLERAALLADECWDEALKKVHVGMSELEVAGLLEASMRSRGLAPSFQTVVNAGAKTDPGHGSPTQAILEPGDLLHVDFGVVFENYCSDIQRLAYFKRVGEMDAPDALRKAFNKIKAIVDKTSSLYKPGSLGHEIDSVARAMLSDDGYPHYDHGLGHQIGLAVHDGGAMVGPLWPRYGKLPTIPLEACNCFTVELGIKVEGIGYVGLEEDLEVTAQGGRFMGPRQTDLRII